MFGLASNFWIALLGRVMWGFLNGNLGVSKTYISEICNDYTQNFGFTLFTCVGGIATYMLIYLVYRYRTIGPTIGGYLSRPEENMPALTRLFPILREVG